MLGPGAIADLPLLQVPGHTVLPGVIQVMLISGPEWVHCFSELQALATEEAQPARFGHLQAYENIGVLMELREVRPLANGRLVVVARAICRFRVASSTALEPLPRANVVLLPDDEELGLTRLRRETDASPAGWLPRQTRAEAARAAAAAAALTWAASELPPSPKSSKAGERGGRSTEGGVEGSSTEGSGSGVSGGGGSSSAGEEVAALLPLAEAMSPFVSSIGDHRRWHEVGEALAPMNLQLSIAGCTGVATEAAIQAAKASIEYMARPAAPAEVAELVAEASAEAAAAEAAAEAGEAELFVALESLGLEQYSGLTVPTGADSSAPPDATVAAATSTDASTTTDASTPFEVNLASTWASDSSPFLLALEHATWVELISCLRLSAALAASEAVHLSAVVRAVGGVAADGVGLMPTPPPLVLGPRAADDAVALPEQLLLLMPPPPRQGWPEEMPSPPSSATWLQRWGYPPVRRAQRLSYLIGAALPTLLASTALPAGLPLPPPPASLDRQALLQATSVRERLQRTAVFLCHTRQSLAALAALRAVG